MSTPAFRKTSRLWLLLGGCLLSGLLLPGCKGLPVTLAGHRAEPLKEPPYLPAASLFESNSLPAEGAPKPSASSLAPVGFSDLSGRGASATRLKEAVDCAIRLGVLKPQGISDVFEPSRPVSFGQFRQWTIAYQNGIAGYNKAASQESATTMNPESVPVQPLKVSLLTVLPAEMKWDGHLLRESSSLSRQELCALYVFLTQQDGMARLMSETEIVNASPTESGNEGFSQFQDYEAVNEWARRYVALAYRDKVLQTAFGLSPAQLTTAEDLNPTQTVTREEAVLLLHSLFVGNQAQRLKEKPTSKPQGPEAPLSPTPAKAASSLPPASGGQPQPITRFQSVRESGPQGGREALRMDGPP